MRIGPKSFSVGDHWPPIVGALVAVCIPIALLGLSDSPSQLSQSKLEPDLLRVVSDERNRNESTLDQPIAPNQTPPSEIGPTHSDVEVSSGETESAEAPDANEVSELKRRIADWRYTGYLQSADERIAIVQRMRYPDRTLRVSEGESIQEVRLEEIASERILVSYGEEREEIYLDQGDPFDLSTVEIPMELADRPEALADLVFAQTLGRYLPEGGAMIPAEDESEGENEALQALSESEGLPEPYYGDTVEEFVGRLAENLPEGLDPSGYKLSDEVKNRLFGF